MSLHLTTDADLAEQFGLTVDKLHDLRKRHGWPHVRLSRFDYRFTYEQIQAIIASRSVTPDVDRSPVASGLTARSAARTGRRSA